MEETKTDAQPTPTPDPTAEFKKTAIRMGTWFLVFLAMTAAAVVAALVTKYLGVTVQPPPVMVEGADQAKAHAAMQKMAAKDDEPPPPDVLHFCGLRENLLDRLTARPWPNKTIKWSIDTDEYVGPLRRAQIVEAFDVAWKAWARDLDIQPTYVTDEDAADVRSRFGVVFDDDGQPDGPSGILAWSELSDGSGRPRRQMYDRAEPWTISGNPGQAQIDVVRVAAHEIGHAMGLVHAPVGTPELMAPTYSRVIQFPTDGDVARAAALGYPRRTTGSSPAPTIELKVSADPEKLAELLRKAGYKVTSPKK